ncbi:hypothetical protein GCM10008995_12990 [Halobellus salinus]|uniref:Rpa-associated protein n=1 Tax=Halobellus salinus TaxID=931585 RepID=A0A830EF90_9EURY|nr:hypothetical protein [Halobellus salinus]GGJ04543.1 hypothetical protein GCM10008995_12990 [Halobellus salinus]SMP09087.1 hypothetical protein SAMN06265347_10375 [Halobellus salinus]
MSDEIQEREVARRVFAAEFNDATLSYSESDEERAPNYVVTPTGARVNRVFAAGALTTVEAVNDDALRGRIADPTGAFVTYAGQYQPDAAAFLERATPPCFVSITGKGRTYQPEDSDRIFTSVRPESLTEVDADTRDRWVVAAAVDTLDRIATMAAALDIDARADDLRTALESRGVDAAHASGVALAIDHYRPTEHYLEAVRTLTVQALELVAGDRDTVETLDVAPDESGPGELGALPEVPAASLEPGDTSVDSAGGTPESGDTSVDSAGGTPESSRPDVGGHAADGVDAATTMGPETGSDAAADADNGSTADATADHTADAAATTTAAQESGSADTAAEPGQPDATASDPAASELSMSADDAGDTDRGSDQDADDLGDFGAGDPPDESDVYELDEAERAEVESEYGTEFATGNEVDDPGEADIDVPDVDDLEAEAAAAAEGDTAADVEASPSSPGIETEPTTEASPEGAADTGSDADTDIKAPDAAADTDIKAPDAAADIDLETTAVEVMNDLDDGDGADQEAVVETVVEKHGVDPDAVESAIQDALMGGKCYEPAEGRLKAI